MALRQRKDGWISVRCGVMLRERVRRLAELDERTISNKAQMMLEQAVTFEEQRLSLPPMEVETAR